MNPADLAGMLEMLAQALRLMPAGAMTIPAPVAAPMPVTRTLGDWLDVHADVMLTRGYHQQTLKNRRSNMAHVRRLWGAKPLAELKAQEIAAKLRTLSTSSAGRVLGELRDAYREAIVAGWIETSPADHIKAPRHKVLRERLMFDAWQQMLTLSRCSPQRWVQSMLLLALTIGQRRADLAKVAFDDVVTDDGGAKYLRIEQQKKAGKNFGARVEIPLTLRMDCIDMTVGDVIEHCRESAKPGPTLLRQANGRRIEMSSLSARFCECIKAVLGAADPGEYKRPSLHEVRSLSARCYIAQGMPPAVVQTLLGHSDLEMTRLYLHERGANAQQWKRVTLA